MLTTSPLSLEEKPWIPNQMERWRESPGLISPRMVVVAHLSKRSPTLPAVPVPPLGGGGPSYRSMLSKGNGAVLISERAGATFLPHVCRGLCHRSLTERLRIACMLNTDAVGRPIDGGVGGLGWGGDLQKAVSLRPIARRCHASWALWPDVMQQPLIFEPRPLSRLRRGARRMPNSAGISLGGCSELLIIWIAYVYAGDPRAPVR